MGGTKFIYDSGRGGKAGTKASGQLKKRQKRQRRRLFAGRRG